MKKNKISKITPYFYILPSIFILIAVYLYPIIRLSIDSLYRFSGGEVVFIKLQNYIYLLTRSENVKTAVLNNLKLLLVIPVLLIVTLSFAFIFYEGIKGAKTYRAIIFLPKVISIVVVGIVFSYLLRMDGIINHFFEIIHLDFLVNDWIGNYKIAIYSVMFVIIWKEIGFGIVLFSARLSSIDEAILEAAKIDGANWFQRLIYIVIPQLRSIINFFIIYNVMIMFAWMFAYIFIITGGGPGNATTILELEIYKYAFERNLYGLASALSILLLFGTLIFIFLQNIITRDSEF